MGRAPCCDKNGLKKGPWTKEEDKKLVDYIQKNGYGSWRTLPKNAGLARCGKSCRLRWTNYLRPDIKRGRFSFDEEEAIIQLHRMLGNKWSVIASRLPGRTDNEIKNYWNTHIRKRLLRMGIDPVTHSPRIDLLDLSSLLGPLIFDPTAHIDASRLLGVEPFVNPELVILAATLLSYQNPSSNFENQLPQAQDPYPSFQNPNYQEQQNTLMAELQIMQANEGQNIQSNFTTDSWPESLMVPFADDQSIYQNLDDENTNIDAHIISRVYNDHLGSNPSSVPLNAVPNYVRPDSVMSTPASSPSTTHLNSTSTMYVSSGAEDERDSNSNCSGLFRFQIPDLWNVNGFM